MIKKVFILFIILLTHLYLLENTLFTLWPEMIVYPYLLNNHFLLYRDIINPYTPLFIEFLKFFSRYFGYLPLPYQILTWANILLIDLLIFIFSFKISKSENRAVLSTLFFIFTSVAFSINGLWFDLVQTPLILTSIYLFYFGYKQQSNRKLALSFIPLAIAFFIKQQVIWLILSFILVLIFDKRKQISKKIPYILYFCIPFAVLLSVEYLYFKSKGTENDFIYWAFYFPFIKSSGLPGYILLPNIKQILVTVASILIFMPILKDKKSPKILLFFGIILILFALPRFDYFHLIPSFSVFAILFSSYHANFRKQRLISTISLLSLFVLLIFCARYYPRNWNSKIRFFEPEVQMVASFVRFLGSPSPIYIQNGPDQIYPLSTTLPPKPWVDEFPWYLEKSDLQDRVVASFIREKPKIILFQPYSKSSTFDLGTYRPKKIADYLDENYTANIKITDNMILKKKK